MAKLTVEVVTPEKRILSMQVDEAVVPGGDGLFGVRPGHTAFLSLMEPGVLTLVSENGTRRDRFFVSGGFVEVGNDVVRVLADGAEPVAGIDVEAARRRLSDASERLKALAVADARHALEQATVRRETARIAAAG